MTATIAAVLLLELVLVVGLAVIGYQAGRIRELSAAAGCAAGEHPWQLMTGGRDGFVRWYRCGRPGCQATRFVKGTEQ